MLVREVMTSPAITVRDDATIRQAARVLDTFSVTAVPVVDGAGHVVGVVSEADLVREMLLPDTRLHMETPPAIGTQPAGFVSEVMTRMPVTVTSDEDLGVAVELMTTTTVKSLPVVDRGRLIGMLSRRDVVRVLARADEAIEAEVNDLFRADGTDWEATVDDGVVEASGPRDAPQRRLAEVLARSVAGVSAVRFLTRAGQGALSHDRAETT
jgi:CBS domain-containing protein